MSTAPMDQRVGADTSNGPPRKRRRRAAAGGATDDCFACRKRAVKCDRKRPYCTQCIEIGKECSGYKTTLTWGVGVASRGKLRGLSCPIASKNAAPKESSAAASSASKSSKPTSVAATSKPHDDRPVENIYAATSAPMSSSQMHPPITAPSYTSSSMPTLVQHTQAEWQPAGGYYDQSHLRHGSEGQQMPMDMPPLLRLQTSATLPPLLSTSGFANGSGVGSYAESEYHTPLEYPRTPRSMAHSDRLSRTLTYPFSDQLPPTSAADGSADRGNPMYHHLQQGLEVVQSSYPSNGHIAMEPARTSGNFDAYGYNEAMLASFSDEQYAYASMHGAIEQLAEEEEEIEPPKGMSLMDSRFASPFFHLNPRMQSLMDYYSRNVCPFIVTFDGPENPYRQHILQLAMHNEGLQHAIAALSANNQRMRKGGTRQTGFIEEISSDGLDGFPSRPDVNEPTLEESTHKQMSIDQLNMQLTDTRAAQDDSVLGTLLILCLFHVCDSGFSKFKTQLAGVQKLLAFRNRTSQSDFTRWVEMFFIWFDVMTSTVNDREMQINRESLAMLDYSANLGALEQYSGVDGRLFKLIARLGRLNLLAQGRPVKGQTPSHLHSNGTSATNKPPHNKENDFRAADYDNLDGNGWGQPIISPPRGHTTSTPRYEPQVMFDDRDEFWAEWHDVRSRLHSWEMDSSSTSNNGGGATQLDENQRHMIHINESFRYSALLYTERLGHPLLPSSHDQLQYLVAQALYHITALPTTSCVNKFLLWPLFITGTECVDEGHRMMIRVRCRNIMEESGFYNNISTLEVLERVWSEAGTNMRGSEAAEVSARRRESTASQTGRYGQAFRWRKAMDRVDGEYIII